MRALALRLALVAVDRAGRDAGRFEQANDLVGAMLGAAEYQRALDRFGRWSRCVSSAVFSAWLTKVTLCSTRSTVVAVGVTETSAGIGQISVGQLLDRLRHGRREEQRLALGRDQRDDPLQRVDEAEIEHLVGLVEHEDFELAKRSAR